MKETTTLVQPHMTHMQKFHVSGEERRSLTTNFSDSTDPDLMSFNIAPQNLPLRLNMWQLTKLDEGLVWGKDVHPPPPPPRQVEWVCSVEGFDCTEGWKPTSLRGFSATVLRFTLDWPPPLALWGCVPRSISAPPSRLDNPPHAPPGSPPSVHTPVARDRKNPAHVFTRTGPDGPRSYIPPLEMSASAPGPPNPFAWSPPEPGQGSGTY